MRIVFMGTPTVALGPLSVLIEKHEVIAVFCQPDKPVGRKQTLTPPPVKELALLHGIPVYQPVTLRRGSAADDIRALSPDVIVVIAYGKILPKEILDIPPYGCINIHASLLPKYRGAAPVQRAIENGETKSGVTIMYMDEGMDTGDIIRTAEFEISADDDAVSVFEKVSEIGAREIVAALEDAQSGLAVRTQQDSEQATRAAIIDKRDGYFSLGDSAVTIANKVRAFCEWPCARFFTRGRAVQVLRARAVPLSGRVGEVMSLDPLTVAVGEGSIEMLTVVPEGSRKMSGREWAAGRRLALGDIIEEDAQCPTATTV